MEKLTRFIIGFFIFPAMILLGTIVFIIVGTFITWDSHAFTIIVEMFSNITSLGYRSILLFSTIFALGNMFGAFNESPR
jgi:hypothetical protein